MTKEAATMRSRSVVEIPELERIEEEQVTRPSELAGGLALMGMLVALALVAALFAVVFTIKV